MDSCEGIRFVSSRAIRARSLKLSGSGSTSDSLIDKPTRRFRRNDCGRGDIISPGG
jgi:hypothetical protein